MTSPMPSCHIGPNIFHHNVTVHVVHSRIHAVKQTFNCAAVKLLRCQSLPTLISTGGSLIAFTSLSTRSGCDVFVRVFGYTGFLKSRQIIITLPYFLMFCCGTIATVLLTLPLSVYWPMQSLHRSSNFLCLATVYSGQTSHSQVDVCHVLSVHRQCL